MTEETAKCWLCGKENPEKYASLKTDGGGLALHFHTKCLKASAEGFRKLSEGLNKVYEEERALNRRTDGTVPEVTCWHEEHK